VTQSSIGAHEHHAPRRILLSSIHSSILSKRRYVTPSLKKAILSKKQSKSFSLPSSRRPRQRITRPVRRMVLTQNHLSFKSRRPMIHRPGYFDHHIFHRLTTMMLFKTSRILLRPQRRKKRSRTILSRVLRMTIKYNLTLNFLLNLPRPILSRPTLYQLILCPMMFVLMKILMTTRTMTRSKDLRKTSKTIRRRSSSQTMHWNTNPTMLHSLTNPITKDLPNQTLP